MIFSIMVKQRYQLAASFPVRQKGSDVGSAKRNATRRRESVVVEEEQVIATLRDRKGEM